MKFFGEVPREFGSKRRPSSDVRRTLAVLNGDDPHTYEIPGWHDAHTILVADLRNMQAVDYEREHLDPLGDGVMLHIVHGDDGEPPSLSWAPPFIPPDSLFVNVRAVRDFLTVRR